MYSIKVRLRDGYAATFKTCMTEVMAFAVASELSAKGHDVGIVMPDGSLQLF